MTVDVRKLLKTKIPLTLAAASLLIFALWVAPTIESRWEPAPQAAVRHQVRLGVLEYVEVSIDRPEPASSWISSVEIRPGGLLGTGLLTALIVGLGYWGSQEWLKHARAQGG